MWKHIKLITLREASQRTDPVDSFSLSGPQYLVSYMRIQFDSVEKKAEGLFFLDNPAIHPSIRPSIHLLVWASMLS